MSGHGLREKKDHFCMHRFAQRIKKI